MYLRSEDGITMNPDRLIPDAKAIVLSLAETGYRPPAPAELPVFGKPLSSEMELGVYLMRKGGHITDYEAQIAKTGERSLRRRCDAPVDAGTVLSTWNEAFKSLCGEPKTLARIEHLLKKGKPLRN